MLILRALQDSQGSVWRCKLKNLYAIEVTVPALKEDSGENTEKVCCKNIYSILISSLFRICYKLFYFVSILYFFFFLLGDFKLC